MRQNFFVSIPSFFKLKEKIDYKEAGEKLIYLVVPIIVFLIELFAFFYLPIEKKLYIQSECGALYILMFVAFGVFISLLGGWMIPAIFSFLGSIRMVYQTIAALVLLCCIVSIVILHVGSADLNQIEKFQQGGWFCFVHFPVFFLYFFVVSMINGQAPFNLPKSERSLATGVYSQHCGLAYQIMSFNDNMMLVLLTFYGVFLFLGGCSPIYFLDDWPMFVSFSIKIFLMLLILSGMKVALPDIKSEEAIKISFAYVFPVLVFWELLVAFVKVL
ncbi:MAG: NADH-quinone oxidoreductase subunit H [Alphaproteobacteria bacterium]|nr:NADH-quinone oxidoreductase subunit H [Alphaproteobacteria bacterium]